MTMAGFLDSVTEGFLKNDPIKMKSIGNFVSVGNASMTSREIDTPARPPSIFPSTR
jgi:hypothetical protein